MCFSFISILRSSEAILAPGLIEHTLKAHACFLKSADHHLGLDFFRAKKTLIDIHCFLDVLTRLCFPIHKESQLKFMSSRENVKSSRYTQIVKTSANRYFDFTAK